MSGAAERRRQAKADAAQFEELLAEALEQQAEGLQPDLDALCADCPQLRRPLAETLGMVHSLPGMPSGAGGRDPLLGSLLGGRYVVSECIGAGAMGVVYRGDDTELRRQVAIKVVRPECLGDPERAERFVREGDALAALSHPAVVAVYDRGQTPDGRAFLVMEHLAGLPLTMLYERGVELRDAVRMAADVARGLEAAHAAGVFHRDVKPSNILVTDRGPVLIDFGIAAVADEATLARGTEGLGTPAYMAPEQLNPGHPAAATADVYGLAAMLYHSVTGAPPYEGSAAQVLAAVARDLPRPAGRARPQLPRDLLAILDRGMERDPSRRYPTAAALRQDLEAFLDYKPVAARYPRAVERLWRRVRRSVAVRAVAVVLLIGAVAGGAWWMDLQRSEAAEQARAAGWRETWPHIEPLLTLWNPADREFTDPAERDRVRALLDRAAETRPGPLPILPLRAAFAFDHGDRHQAAVDLATLAEETGSAVARALADAYRAAERDPAVAAIDGFAEVPARDADDLYLQAFHEIRRGRYGAAGEILARPELAEHGPAQELLLTIRIATLPSEADERVQAARPIHETALRMEERYGIRTAMTAHLVGGALLAQGRYQDAREAIESGLRLAPRSASLLSNLGIARMRLGDYAGAVDILNQAIAIRPHSRQSHESRFWSLLRLAWLGDEDALDRARRAVEEAPLGAAGQARLLGELEFDQCLRAVQGGDRDTAATHAAAALEAWRAGGVSDPFAVGFAGCVVRREDPFRDALRLAAQNPEEWWKLRTALAVLPDSLDDQQTTALADLLRSLIRDRAPEIVTAGSLHTLPSQQR